MDLVGSADTYESGDTALVSPSVIGDKAVASNPAEDGPPNSGKYSVGGPPRPFVLGPTGERIGAGAAHGMIGGMFDALFFAALLVLGPIGAFWGLFKRVLLRDILIVLNREEGSADILSQQPWSCRI